MRLPVRCWQCFVITGSCTQLKYVGLHNKVAARVETSAMSLQEELVAAMQKAFQVAVQIAVEEVTKLVGRTTGKNYYKMLEENESLRQRLLRAEAMLDERGDMSSHLEQHLDAINHAGRHPYRCYRQKSKDPDVGNSTGLRCGRPARQHLNLQHTRRQQKRGSRDDVKRQHDCGGASDPHGNDGCAGCDALNGETGEEMSWVCDVGVESMTQPQLDLPVSHRESTFHPSEEEKSSLEQVTVKQEKPEEETDGATRCLDSLKMEDLSTDCTLAVQSQILEEWKPEVASSETQDSKTPLLHTAKGWAHPPNATTPLTPAADLPSQASDFPKIFQLAAASVPPPEAPPQVYGVHLRPSRRPSRRLGRTYACKRCGQQFQLLSLLRQHSGQCQQKLQEYHQQPVSGSRRSRLQLFPPGCSPFRCTVCNREFNRMENLKTHLRIHTGERPYTCSVCSKCFRHSGALTRHFRIHTGEKPYVCAHCGKSFRNCGGLKFHQRSHNKQLHQNETQQC